MSGIDLSGLSVAILMVTRDERDTTVPTMCSLVATLGALNEYGIQHETQVHTGGLLTATRSWSVKRFLETKHNRAFLIDSDIVWQTADFMKLLAYSTKYEVLGAGYRAKRDPPFYLVHLDEAGVSADENGFMPVSGMGLGFTCVQRHIFEKLSTAAPREKHLHAKEPFPQVFRFDKIGEEFRGEDMAFLADVRALGYTPRIDPSISLGHLGNKQFAGRVSEHLTAAGIAAE